MTIIKRFFPFLSWFDSYDKKALRTDAIAGLTVALVLVPQSMAYAQLAGLPAYYGLYAAFLPPLVASLFGSSRQLATGPVAVVSLMTAATLEPLATAGSEQYIIYALVLALLVGLFQLTLGILRLGLIVNFLSHPVVSGFSSAAAIIIATSQLSKIFGVYVDKAPHHYETIYRVFVSAFRHTHWPTVGMAVLAISTMLVLRKVHKKIPNVLVAVALTTLLSWAFEFQRNETVSIDQIESIDLKTKMETYNAALRDKKSIEEHERSSSRKTEQLKSATLATCAKCHQPTGVNQLWDVQHAAKIRHQDSSDVFLVHHMAGLIEDRIVELKEKIADTRSEIREIMLVRRQIDYSNARFIPLEEAESESVSRGGIWCIRVGNQALDTEALVLQGGGAVVGRIPEGLPSFRQPVLDWEILPKLLFAAIIISLLGFMEAISIAKAMAARTRQKLDSNQELIGQGLANIVGCLSQSYAVSGSFSRSAVNLQAGARTGLSNVFSSGVVVLVLLFFSKSLYHLPQAVLASVIIMAVVGLLNVRSFVHTWRTSYFDGSVLLITFLTTLLFAPHLEFGIFCGVALSLGGYLFRTMRPRVRKLAPHPDGSIRDCERHGLPSCKYIATLSFEGPLNFASANYLESGIMERVSNAPDLRSVLVAGNGISEIDASGEETIRHLVDDLKDTGITISFSGIPDDILDVFKRSRLYENIGSEHFYASKALAISSIYRNAHEGRTEPDCPYQSFIPPLVELSLHPDGSLRSAERHQLNKCRHIAVFRFDGPFNFANMSFLEKGILENISDRPALRHVVLACHSVTNIDEYGALKLGELSMNLREDGLAVSLTGIKEEVFDVIERTGAVSTLGNENIYSTQLTAISSIFPRAHAGSSESECPLAPVAPKLTELSLHDSGQLIEASSYHLRLCDSLGILRIDGPMALYDRSAIHSEFIRWAKARPRVRGVVFIASKFDILKLREAENLCSLVESVREAGYHTAIAGLTNQAFEVLARNGIVDSLGPESFYAIASLATTALYVEAHSGAALEDDCPLSRLLPKLVELSLHPDGSFRDARRHGLSVCSNIVAVRFDGGLTFATFKYFLWMLEHCLEQRSLAKHILFVAHSLTEIDAIGIDELLSSFDSLMQRGYSVAISGLKDDHLELFQRVLQNVTDTGFTYYPNVARAVEEMFLEAHEESIEAVCPLREVVLIKDGQSMATNKL